MRFLSTKASLLTRVVSRRALSSAGKDSSSSGSTRFDITHRSPVVRGNSSRKDTTSNTSRAWKLSGAFTRFDRSFEVFEVSKAGGLKRTSVTLGDVLRDFGVHARDVLSLGLQDERYSPPPAMLPREGVVVVALGPFKALVHTDACLLFEAGKMDVSHIAPILADLVKANNEVPARQDRRVGAEGGGGDVGGGASSKPSGSAAAAASAPPQPPPQPPLLPPSRPPRPNANKSMDHHHARQAADSVKVKGSVPTAHTGEPDGFPALSPRPPPPPASSPPPAPLPPSTERAGRGVERAVTTNGGWGKGVESEASRPTAGESPISGSLIATKLGEYVEEAFRFGSGGGFGDDRGTGREKKENKEEEEEENVQQNQIKVMFKEQLPMPFELAVIEAMLEEVCTSYHRRAHVVRRLMEQGLKPSETTSFFAPSRIEHYRLVPLKLALKQLELKLSQTKMCLEELMHSDEDMLGLLLTETKELGQGEVLDADRHSVVELLLENYHRQLVLVGHDVATMVQEMESLQELSAISLDVSLNSMIAVDVRLAMLNLGVATSACVFGAMGMNTINGLESSHMAFYFLIGGSAAASAMALGGVMRHLRSVVRAGDSQQGKLMALNTICDHVDDIESVLRTELDLNHEISSGDGGDGGGVINRSALATKLSRARGKEVSDEELDLIFAVFDTTGDGSIDTREYGKLVSEPAGFLGNNGTGVHVAAATAGSGRA